MAAASRQFFTRLALIAVWASILRIWYILDVVHDRIPRLGLSDEFFYHWQARYFAEGKWFTNPFLLHNQGIERPTGPASTALHHRPRRPVEARPRHGHRAPDRDRTPRRRHRRAHRAARSAHRRRPRRVEYAALLATVVSPPLWSNDSVLGLETLFCFLVTPR